MRSWRGWLAAFVGVTSSLLVAAVFVPGALAGFKDAPPVPDNTFNARETFGGTNLASGSYVGNGVDNRAITGLGFSPNAVIVKSHSGTEAVMRTSSISGDASKPLAVATGLLSNVIQSLDAGGFTVGTNSRVNSNGTVYSFVAFNSVSGNLATGSYTGNGGASQAITSAGFATDYVVVMGGGATQAVHRSRTMSSTYRFDPSPASAGTISSLDSGGFTVGSGADVNASGTTYHWVAWNEVAGRMDIGAYTGNGADNRSVTGTGFPPDYAIVKVSTSGGSGVTCDRPMHRTGDVSGDWTLNFINAGNPSDVIQALESNGYQVGTNCRVNTSGATYYSMAWADY